MAKQTDGWIKLHRQILENPIVTKDAEHLAVWIYLLLNATHKDMPVLFGSKKIILHPGQLVTGYLKIASDLNISESKVRRIIKLFKSDEQVDARSCSQGTLISLLNWDKYQLCDEQNDERVPNECRTSDERVTTNKNIRSKECKNNNKDLHIVISLILNSGEEYGITDEDVKEYESLYPNVDVMQQLRNMKGWLNSNPTRRKTKSGIKRFINSWLSKEQDKGGAKKNERDNDTESFTSFQINCNI